MEGMAALGARFLERCRSDLAVLRHPGHPEFRRTVHGLAGTGGVFGYPQISRLANVIDEALADGRAADPADLDALAAEVEAAVRPA